MKKILHLAFPILLLLAALFSQAQNVYRVKNGGGTGDGKTDATAWSPSYYYNSKMNSIAAGDSVTFKAGETFNIAALGMLNGRAGAKYGPYGTGTKPVISGFLTLTSWTSTGNGVYYASIGADPGTILFDGVQRGKGRYPKGTYNFLSYENGTNNTDGTSYAIDNELTNTYNWTGATAVMRTGGTELQPKTVTSHSGTRLNFSSTESWNPGFAYFFQNHPNCLLASLGAEVGDWYYDAVNDRLYVYFGADLPASHTVKAAGLQYLFNIPSRVGTIVSGLAFEGAWETGIVIGNSSSYCKVLNNEVRYCGIGIACSGAATYCTIDGNNVHDCTNRGLSGAFDAKNISITNNYLQRIGMIPGAAPGGDKTYSGIYFEGGENFFIGFNKVDSTGGTGIRAGRGNNTRFHQNIVDGYGFVKIDIGAFNFWSSSSDPVHTGRLVDSNIIRNARPEGGIGTMSRYSQNALYCDTRSDNINFLGNLIDSADGKGFHSVDAYQGLQLNWNIFYKVNGKIIHFQNNLAAYSGIVVKNNVSFARVTNDVMAILNLGSNFTTVGIFDYNYYRSASATAIETQISGGAISQRNLLSWQTVSGQDAHAVYKNEDGTPTKFVYNDHWTTDSTVTFPGKQYRDVMTGTLYNNSITVKPFTGRVLEFNANLTSNTAPVLGGALAASSVTQTTLTLTAPAATDNSTAQSQLVYSYYQNGVQIASGANLLSVNVTGLTPGASYNFYYTVTDLEGLTTTSSTISQTTLPPTAGAPTLTLGTVTSTTVGLTIGASANASSYSLQDSTVGGSWVTVRTSLSAGAVTVNEAPGTVHYFRAFAVNASGNSAYSNVVTATTPTDVSLPAAPTGIAATNITTTTATASWSAVSGATGYKFYISTSPTEGFTSTDVTGTSVNLSSLQYGQTYYIKVSAVNGAGEGPQSSIYSFTTQANSFRAGGKRNRNG